MPLSLMFKPLDPINPFAASTLGKTFQGLIMQSYLSKTEFILNLAMISELPTGCSDDKLKSALKTRGCQGQETGGRRKAV